MLAFLRDLVSRAQAAIRAWKAPIQDHNGADYDASVVASKSPPRSEIPMIPANDAAKKSETLLVLRLVTSLTVS